MITSGRFASGDRVLRQFLLGIDEPPAVPNAMDDEFDDESFDTGKWTWLDQGPTTVYETDKLYFQSSENANRIRGIYQAAPSGSWTFRGAFEVDRLVGSYGIGLMAAESTSANVRFAGLWGTELRPLTFSTPSSSAATWGSLGRLLRSIGYAELAWDGTNLAASVSHDGDIWSTMASTALGYTPAHVGVAFMNYSNAYRRASSFWFRRVG
jgi:hypothetical protein